VPVQTNQGAQPAGQYVIQKIINDQLVQQLAKKKHVEPTEAQINMKIDYIRKQNGGDLKRFLASRGMVLNDLKQQLILEQSGINLYTMHVKVSDSELKQAYEEGLKAKNSPFVRPEQVMISAIVCKSKDKIDKAYKMLKDKQEFSTVAMRMSEAPDAKQTGGRLDWVSIDDKRLPPAAAKAVFALPLADYTAQMKFGKDWVIFRAARKRPKKITKLNEVKNILREQLAMAKAARNNTFQRDMLKFAEQSDIVVNAERYKNIPDELKKRLAQPAQSTPTGATPGQPTRAAATRPAAP